MPYSENRVNNYIAQLGKRLRTSLEIKNGLCVLHDERDQEAIVIESPKGGSVVIFHCKAADSIILYKYINDNSREN